MMKMLKSGCILMSQSPLTPKGGIDKKKEEKGNSEKLKERPQDRKTKVKSKKG